METQIISSEKTLVDCPRCGLKQQEANSVDKHLCNACVQVENSRITYFKQKQGDWLAIAAESGLDPWLQQPGETQWEYTVWCNYRDSYPGKKPTYGSVAQHLDTTYHVVNKIAQRWSFPVRMQAWMKHVDDITMVQRRNEILEMNKVHVDMAKALNDKLALAIAGINPVGMKPSEIASLVKTSAELERKARLDTIEQEVAVKEYLVDNANPDLKQSPTKHSDFEDVLQIMSAAGVLGTIGMRKTETTEVVFAAADDIDSPAVTRQTVVARQ